MRRRLSAVDVLERQDVSWRRTNTTPGPYPLVRPDLVRPRPCETSAPRGSLAT